MLKKEQPATIEMLTGIQSQLCALQEVVNEMWVSHWGLINAVAENDSSFGARYNAQKEVIENSPTGKALTQRLGAMKNLLAKMNTG